MNAADRPRPAGAVLSGIGLGLVFALGIAFTTYMLMDSWGGTSWVLDLVISVAVCARSRCCAGGGPWERRSRR
ncbi:hypothetical protein ABT299_26890 [Spirillospora sp. NPDC000708]